jgi:hypothetical protein
VGRPGTEQAEIQKESDATGMLTFTQLEAQTMTLRTMTQKLLGGLAGRADEMPPTWKNNARWHAGHLVVTPRLLTFGMTGEPLGVDENYRKWFGKGSSPAEWGGDAVPSFEQLCGELTSGTSALFAAMAERQDAPFAKPYTTSMGAVLNTPAEALNFSLAHDGIHIGLLIALKRALGV